MQIALTRALNGLSALNPAETCTAPEVIVTYTREGARARPGR